MALPPEAPKRQEKEEEVELQGENVETLPFQKFEEEPVKNLTEKYAEGVEIAPSTRKVLDGLLARDSEEAYQKFALDYFEKNKERIQKETGMPIEGVSDEWKISMVLRPKEKGGIGAAAEIRGEDYKEQLGDIVDKIVILRADLAKEPISPEAPFLMLNYLQGSIAEEKRILKELRAKAEAGSAAAAIDANAKEAEIKSLLLARRELAGKALGEDLTETAEQELTKTGFTIKERYIADGIDKREQEEQEKRKNELMDKEWQAYSNLTPQQKKKYQSRLGVELEESRKDFDKRPHPDGKNTEADFQESNRQIFRLGLKQAAEKNGVKGLDVYGMLEQGYKPHEIKAKGFFVKKMIVGGREMSADQLKGLARSAGDSFLAKISTKVEKDLEDEWEWMHEQSVDKRIEERISKLAASPEAAEGGVEAIYEKARKRIIDEYIKAHLEKNPRTKEEMGIIEKRLNKGGKDRNINDLIAETFPDEKGKFKGRLRNLRPWNKNMNRASFGAIKNFLTEDFGVEVDMSTVKRVMTEEKYNRALKTKNLFHLCLEIVMEQMGVKPSKKAGKKKAA